MVDANKTGDVKIGLMWPSPRKTWPMNTPLDQGTGRLSTGDLATLAMLSQGEGHLLCSQLVRDQLID